MNTARLKYLANETPENWSFIRLKNIGFMYGGLSGKSGKDFLNEEYFNSCYIPFTSICNDINVRSKELKQVVIDENENQNKVEKYDLFFLMSSENFDDIGKTAILLEDLEEVYLNSFCKGFRVTNKSISPLFLNYCLNSTFYRQFLSTKGRGFTRINIRKNSVMSFGIKFPPYHLQLTIANYLNKQIKKIKTFITKKQTFIKLLKEQRQSVINNAVTKGLDKNVKLKSTGIDWLGDIPEHWEVRRLKSLYSFDKGSGLSKLDITDKGNNKCLLYGELFTRLKGYNIVDDNFQKTNIEQGKKSQGNEILIPGSTTTTSIDLCNCKTLNHSGILLGGDIIILRPLKTNILNEFYSYFISSICKPEFVMYGRGVTIHHIYANQIGNMMVTLPLFSEQTQIVSHIKTETEKIDQAIAKAEKEIELIQEYQKAMIAESVLGKLNYKLKATSANNAPVENIKQ